MIKQVGRFYLPSTFYVLTRRQGGFMKVPLAPKGAVFSTNEDGLCPMPNIAKLIGGKWKLIILQILIFRGMQRFNTLRRKIEGITQTMLTKQLRALEEDGLVERTIYAEIPPRVEYRATKRAHELQDMFLAMHAWWVKENPE